MSTINSTCNVWLPHFGNLREHIADGVQKANLVFNFMPLLRATPSFSVSMQALLSEPSRRIIKPPFIQLSSADKTSTITYQIDPVLSS